MLLIDCGHGALARLTEIGVDPRDIDAMFLSHFHTDHIGDAFNLIHARFVGDLYEGKEHRQLVCIGPKTLEARFRKWREISWPEPNEEYPLEFHEGTLEHQVGDIRLKTFAVQHVPWFDSIGVRIETAGRCVVYPGDTGSSQGVASLVAPAAQADVLIIEAGYDRPTPNHFTLDQIVELTRRANVMRTLIVHLKPVVQEEERVRRFIADKPNFILAEDKMVLEL